MKVACTCDLSAFQKGLRAKVAVSKKSVTDITNRAAGDVCLKSIKYTPRARNPLGGELLQDGFLMRMVYAIYHPVGGQKKARERVPGQAQSDRRNPAATRVPGYTRAQMKQLANRLLTHRRRSRGFIAAGWYKAAQAFGKALARKVSAKGTAGKGYGKKARSADDAAIGANLATGAAVVGTAALQKALDEVGRDMQGYAAKKIAGEFNKR